LKITKGKIKGVLEIIFEPFIDHRGLFMRTFEEKFFAENKLGIQWVQENHSISALKNTLRGLHFVLPPFTDGKLIRCIKGELFDIFVDLRKDSVSFGTWASIILTEKDFKWLYLPKGFAHGFCTLTDHTEVIYKHDVEYNKGYDSGIIWNDVDLSIEWPCNNPVLSEKDNNLMTLKEFVKIHGGL
jgi:dTDP-4-dehydrorhamnose 3,5-epimerase